MKITALEKKEPKPIEFKKEQRLTDKNVELNKIAKKEIVQSKKEVYKRPDFLYHLL